MKISTNQTGNAIDRGPWATRNIMPAKAKSITGSGFEQRFCGILVALILTIVAIASFVLTHLSAPLVSPDALSIAFRDLL